MENNIVDIKDLTFSYGDGPILKDINFSIKERDFVGIIGPNGGGKTTLVKIILGLLPVPNGAVRVFGGAPLEHPHKIAYLPQHLIFDPALPITVNEVVMMGCLGHGLTGFYSPNDKKRALAAMEKMNVADIKGKLFSSLSGGQRQRVLIARALTCRPKILVLDEPSSGIDSHHEEILYNLLKELNKEMAIVLISHEYNFVSPLVDYVICVNKTGHVHEPSKITKQNFQDLISSRYQHVPHDHDMESK